MATTIQITDKVWVELNKRRLNSSETFNEVIERLLFNKIGFQGSKPCPSNTKTKSKDKKE